MRPSGSIAIALTLVVGACGAHGAAEAGNLAGGPARAATASPLCRPLALPATLPPADVLVDSAALVRAAAVLLPAPGDARSAVVALRFDPDGVNVRRDVIEHDLTPALADSLQRLVFAHRRRTPPAEREWAVRLRLEFNGEPTARTERGLGCEPHPRERLAIASTVGNPWSVWREAVPVGGGEAATVWVRVRIDERGMVMDARADRIHGPRSTEAHLIAYVRSLHWIPATEDGHPVQGETSIAVRLPR
jgi:hypothetical protein